MVTSNYIRSISRLCDLDELITILDLERLDGTTVRNMGQFKLNKSVVNISVDEHPHGMYLIQNINNIKILRKHLIEVCNYIFIEWINDRSELWIRKDDEFVLIAQTPVR